MGSRKRSRIPKGLLKAPKVKLFHRSRKKVGSAPGTLHYAGPERTEPVSVRLVEYDPERLKEEGLSPETDFQEISRREPITWVNVDGLNHLGLMEQIGSAFGLHPLVVEDLVHTGQRPKVEEYGDYLFVILRMLTSSEGSAGIQSEQVGIIVGEGYVLSFQERAGDVWDPVRERIRVPGSRIRMKGADYLAYALMDTIVDHYFHILENLADRAEALEVEVLGDPATDTMHRIHDLRQEMLVIRRAVWPLRELTSSLLRTESTVIREGTEVFLRDVHDHTVQVIDMTETLRDVVSSLMDLYLSAVSNRMNEIMKVLTIMASLFIPLTFLAGIYGMNFQYMPELGFRWAYPALLGLMAAVGGGLLFYFKKQDWF